MQKIIIRISIILIIVSLVQCTEKVSIIHNLSPEDWSIDSQEEWQLAIVSHSNISFKQGQVLPTDKQATLQSLIKILPQPSTLKSIIVKQSDIWENWNKSTNIGPSNLADAPVMLSLGSDNYWMFGRYGKLKTNKQKPFVAQQAILAGFDEPLLTTPLSNVFNAKGGLQPKTGGYHAWQSKDMVNWVHRGPITEKFSKWMTTAEYVDGKFYFYYDFPNDQDPHLYIDKDLMDGKPGENKGLVFNDPSHGSDCTFIRDKDGMFHVIYEDWSPLNPMKNSCDSPLAGHAVSADGIGGFTILPPAYDERTEPTGKFAEYSHPHWHAEAPDKFPAKNPLAEKPRAFAKYEIHEPKQNAYGDWASICIGDQYYLFADFDPKDGHGSKSMSTAWFTSSSLDKPFEFCSNIGKGHPDPDIMFAEGKFYLATQQKLDFTSPGPWVETVTLRVGVDSTNDGAIDTWSDWQQVKEHYDYTPGFAKHVQRTAAAMDLSALPKAYAVKFEVKITDTTVNKSKPILDAITLNFH